MAAGRRSARCSSGSASNRASSTACASPTPRPRRSPRWCWPDRSTRKSSAGSARPAAARSAFRARTRGWSSPRRSAAREPDRNSSIERHVDLGFVGEPEHVDRDASSITLSAAGIDPGGRADRDRRRRRTPTTSTPTRWRARSPAALGAARLFLLTDVAGVLDKDEEAAHRSRRPPTSTRLKADGTISGGMIPKLETCVARGRGRGRRRGHPRRARAAMRCCSRSSRAGRGHAGARGLMESGAAPRLEEALA